MYKVTLTKLSNNKNALRTSDVVGACFNLPEIDKPFRIFGAGIEFGNRMVTTSPVKSIEIIDDVIRFNTLNSTYSLKVKEEVQEDAEV